ncbi:MAG: mycothiol synthase [Pseudonocardiales bacterium]|jgi:mycothiol synthase|nr:mycothiol synthase [Pseudonocardiales bacterium]
MSLALTWLARLREDQIADVLALLAAAKAVDGVHAISEAAMLRLGSHSRSRTGMHLLAHDSAGSLVGYAALDERAERPTAEFVVHPEHRRHGIGGAVLAALFDRVDGPLWVWAHGEHPAALRLVQRAGLVSQRELLQLRRGLADPIPARPLPDGVVLRAFVPGDDEAAVVRVNHRAFGWHPEQSRLDVSELLVLETQPWFDPQGFLLAVDPDDRLLGFHWTKVHSDGLGEVYVLAVDPDAQGTGLGSALTVAGLAHLRARRVLEAMLYVDSDNAAAVRTYQKLGFAHHHTDVEFLLDPARRG